jgi:heme a synthase
MVSSGLTERVDVSQYRLALHLSVAFAILSLLVWLALEERAARLCTVSAAVSQRSKRLAGFLVALVFAQVALGAFVAGLRAGLVYNTWPLMDGQIVPSDYWLEGRGLMSVFESHGAAQFNHRFVAYVLLVVAAFQAWALSRGSVAGRQRLSGYVLCAAVSLQAALGIVTVLSHVPLSLGLVHQAGAAVVLAIAVWHLFETRRALA